VLANFISSLVSFLLNKSSFVSVSFYCVLRYMERRRGLPSSDENSVCPSVKRVICDKTKVWCVQIFISYERSLWV